MITATTKFTLPVDEVLQTVADYLGIDKTVLTMRGRYRDIVYGRQIAMYALSRMGGTSVSIGALFSKDHSTVLHSIRTVNDLMDTNPEYKSDVLMITELCMNLLNKTA